MNRVLPAISLLLLLVAAPGAARADEEPRYYFYHGLDYGTDSLIHPLRLVVNGGWGIMQLLCDNHPLDIDYRQGWKNVWRNLADPGGAIQAEGWWDFLQREVIPISFNSGKAHYWPNYTQHLLGGGMSYRMITEWYRAHGYEHASTWSGATLMSYHLLNEEGCRSGRPSMP